jgi:hypothetical protein
MTESYKLTRFLKLYLLSVIIFISQLLYLKSKILIRYEVD